jgi:hypothetical protein
MKSKLFIFLALIAIVGTSKQCKNKDVQGARYANIVLMPTIDSLINKFSEGITFKDSISIFVILKNIDANSLKIYLVAKKPLRSDFESIGIPVTTFQKNSVSLYFYTGLEKIAKQDTTFWRHHIEIYDDRLKQKAGLYETSIVKKEVYVFENEKLQQVQPFDDMIFVGNPVDTIKFR